jgi:hypothetical protein
MKPKQAEIEKQIKNRTEKIQQKHNLGKIKNNFELELMPNFKGYKFINLQIKSNITTFQ